MAHISRRQRNAQLRLIKTSKKDKPLQILHKRIPQVQHSSADRAFTQHSIRLCSVMVDWKSHYTCQSIRYYLTATYFHNSQKDKVNIQMWDRVHAVKKIKVGLYLKSTLARSTPTVIKWRGCFVQEQQANVLLKVFMSLNFYFYCYCLGWPGIYT